MNVAQIPKFRHQNRPGMAEVLVVDDLPFNRAYVGELLGQLGISCRYAADGTEAITLSLAFRFSAILMDLEMRDMDGDVAARWLKKLGSPTASVPIIAITSLRPTEARLRCFQSGIALVLSKPITRRELEDALRTHAPGLLDSPTSTEDVANVKGLVRSVEASTAARMHVPAEIPHDQR